MTDHNIIATANRLAARMGGRFVLYDKKGQTMTDEVEVTRADREAAADIAQEGGLYPTPIIDDIREGRRDYLLIVQAFARHRLASTDPLMGEVREAAAFLVARLKELEFVDGGYDQLVREYFGHVEPALERLDALLARIEEPKG